MGINIIEGLASGVSAGLVLAIFFWMLDRYKKSFERKEQIRHLASIIVCIRGRPQGVLLCEPGPVMPLMKREAAVASYAA